eukprot:m51a1_g10364 hypothetical protein (633) ;mRNA; f:75031-77472
MEKRSVWVMYEEPGAQPADAELVDLDAEVLDVNHLKTFLMAKLEIPYRARDIFLDLPEGLGTSIYEAYATDASATPRTLDPTQRLGSDLFDALESLRKPLRPILVVRVRPGARPLPTQPTVGGMVYATVEEGINTTVPHSRRQQTCAELLDYAQGKSFLLVRAPPKSGKTALIDMLVFNTAGRTDLQVYRVNGSHKSRYNDAKNTASRLISDETGGAVDLAEKGGRPQRLILVDEAQALYGFTEDPIWAQLKELMHIPDTSICIVFFALHNTTSLGGVATPFVPEERSVLEPSFLNFREGELLELIDSYNVFARVKGSACITEQLRDVLLAMSGGNVGLISFLIGRVFGQYRHSDNQPRDEDVAKFIQGFDTMNACCLHPRIAPLYTDMTSECQKCLAQLLLRPQAVDVGSSAFRTLLRAGVVSESCRFSSPLHQWFYAKKTLYQPAETGARVTDLRQAVQNAIAAMDPQTLSDAAAMSPAETNSSTEPVTDATFARGSLVERTYTMEFYRAFSRQLHVGSVIVPERAVYHNGKLSGFVDFFVNGSLSWALEFLMQGIGRRHHQRFGAGGKYDIGDLKQWLIVDFHYKKGTRPSAIPENTWVVVFNETFTAASIYSNAGLVNKINVIGNRSQ